MPHDPTNGLARLHADAEYNEARGRIAGRAAARADMLYYLRSRLEILHSRQQHPGYIEAHREIKAMIARINY